MRLAEASGTVFGYILAYGIGVFVVGLTIKAILWAWSWL